MLIETNDISTTSNEYLFEVVDMNFLWFVYNAII